MFSTEDNMTENEIIEAALGLALHRVDDILATWRNRRWAPTIKQTNRIDFICTAALRHIGQRYPNFVYKRLAGYEDVTLGIKPEEGRP